jgi:hypothetical protein
MYASRRTRQTTGKMSASQAAAMVAATQTVEDKKKKRKRTGPAVSVDTTAVSFSVEPSTSRTRRMTPSR